MTINAFAVVIGALGVFSSGIAAAPSSPGEPENMSGKVAVAINHLAVDLYKVLGRHENAVLSPFSIQTAAAMVYLGARGSSAEEMRRVLAYERADLPQDQVATAFKQVLNGLLAEPKNYTLDVANRALIANNYPVYESYKEALIQNFKAELDEVNFGNGVAVMKSINNWVNQKTRGKIEKLLDEPLDSRTVLALLNAVYFKGTWKFQFEEKKTKLQPFYNSGVTEKNVQMMHMEADTNYTSSSDLNCQVLQLPYVGEDLSMVFILPNAKDGLSALEEQLNYDKLQALLKRLRPSRDINIKLPRFKFDKEYDLITLLGKIGLQKIFGPASDLTGIAPAPPPLYVSKAIHKAVVEVNEEGSEAAAVTGFFIQPLSSNSKPQRISNDFHADHPFIFAILEKSTGLILFIGRVDNF